MLLSFLFLFGFFCLSNEMNADSLWLFAIHVAFVVVLSSIFAHG